MSTDRSAALSRWPDGVARHLLDEVGSTNAEAERLAPRLTVPTWILARRQTAARGRRGRAWESPEGNFAATLVMKPAGRVPDIALRSFTAALALAEAMEHFTGPAATIGLKWPNDVLLNGGKVAGILLESAGQGGKIAYLSIGIGVNLTSAPPAERVEPGARTPVSLLGETGIRAAPEEFLTPLAAAFAAWEARLLSRGFAPVRDAWLSRAARLGQTITARTTAESVEGRFETIADDGALVLATAAGRRHIPAADVFF